MNIVNKLSKKNNNQGRIKMNRKAILFLFAIILLILVALTFHFVKDKEKAFSILIGLITAVSSLGTVIIAILLYERFGVSKKIVNYQLEAVFNLISVLQSTSCFVSNGKLNYQLYFGKDLNDIKPLVRKYKDENKKIVFKTADDVSKGMDRFYTLINDYWLPSEIKNKLKFLDFLGYVDEGNYDMPNNVLIGSYGGKNASSIVLTSKNYTFLEYIFCVESLKNEIESWLKRHTDIRLDINKEFI